eukprot:scaffold9759_cov126-Isochrysis_galbana.AAC.3
MERPTFPSHDAPPSVRVPAGDTLFVGRPRRRLFPDQFAAVDDPGLMPMAGVQAGGAGANGPRQEELANGAPPASRIGRTHVRLVRLAPGASVALVTGERPLPRVPRVLS